MIYKELFIPYEQALALKELGFDEPCWAWWHIEDQDTRYCYSDERSPITNSQEDWWAKQENREVEIIGLPLYQQAFRWFIKNHDLLGYVSFAPQGFYYYDINMIKPYKEIYQGVDFDTYGEAEFECLKKLIEIVKTKKN